MNTVTLTRERIDLLRTNGTFTTATIEALGLRWQDLKAGWPVRLEGTRISFEQWQRAVEGVGTPAKDYRKLKRHGPELPGLA